MHFKYYLKLVVVLYGMMLCGSAVSENAKSMAQVSQLSVASNSANTLYLLAVKYENAEGVPQDKEEAVELYCQAARLGHMEAQYALGWMYANGRSVPRDDSIAAQLFAMAAEQGHTHAQNMMRYTQTSSESILPVCIQPAIDDYQIDIWTEYSNGPIFQLVNELAPQYEIDPAFVLAIISVESAFKVDALSPKNAQGLMQLIPETAERFQVKNAFDAEDNIRGGMAYLRWLLAFFKGDVTLVAAAYNAGEGAVERHQGIPPYAETIDYVQKIQAHYKKLTHPYQADIVHRHALIALSH